MTGNISPGKSRYIAWTCPECGAVMKGEEVHDPKCPAYIAPSPCRARSCEAPEILDACCGGRMWWWNKEHPLALYLDIHRVEKGSVDAKFSGGKRNGSPGWACEPDALGDFRDLPFEDEAFQMVVFDPPHNVRPGGALGVNGMMYGALHPDTEQDDLRRGFAECWRVLAPGGTLVFKWAGDIKRVKPHFPATPIVGTRVPRGLQTWWLTFYKPLGTIPAIGDES